MSLRAPGSTLAGASVTFSWTTGTGASAYWLDVETVQGQGNIFGQNVAPVTSKTVSYTYSAAAKATMSLPSPGSTLAGAAAYWLDVGMVQGQGNVFGQNVALATSQTVSGIPVNGSTINVRL